MKQLQDIQRYLCLSASRMILTTSRKPSRKTRRLARVLANFMNWEYINRGKLSMDEIYSMLNKGENLAVIEEIKGVERLRYLFTNQASGRSRSTSKTK